jgi:hypothetical protein
MIDMGGLPADLNDLGDYSAFGITGLDSPSKNK